MTDRMIDLSDEPARLSVRNALLVIRRDGREDVAIPLADLAVLIVSHPQVAFTHAVLSGIAAAGGSFVTCNEKHLPVAMLLPLETHSTQAERFALQANAALPVKKRLWRQIVRAKIRAQANLLKKIRGTDLGLPALISRVHSGDPENIEAQASRSYWTALFADPDFRRDHDAQDINRHLNYGYAVLRAITARAICAAGLHPCLGLHHHNRYDPFCLADDLMEPFRPLVDGVVAGLTDTCGKLFPLDRQSKTALLEGLTGCLMIEGESRTLFDVLSRTASSLAAVFMDERRELVLPEVV